MSITRRPDQNLTASGTGALTVAVCTFRRPALALTLRSLAALQQSSALAGEGALTVIVADNDDHAGRQNEIVALGRELGLALRYIHAPARNISVARNACLDHCSSRWLAFIDDDEVADAGWLAALLAGAPGHEIVFGTCQADYPAGTPDWLRQGDFHSNRLSGNDPGWNGYTSNVLIDMDFIRWAQLRFAPELGVSGGEDTLFFFEAHRAGARFGYAPAAVVHEPVAPARLGMGWLWRRRYRAGQVHYLLLQRQGRVLAGTISAGLKALACAAMALAAIGRPVAWRGNLLRGALHLGVLAAALRMPLYREYATGPGA